jgi:hypothetical protein
MGPALARAVPASFPARWACAARLRRVPRCNSRTAGPRQTGGSRSCCRSPRAGWSGGCGASRASRTASRRRRSSVRGSATSVCVNSAPRLSSSSKASTAAGCGPNSVIRPSLIPIDSAISSGWKPHTRGDVEGGVAVMHAVQPPEQRPGVHQPVLPVDRQVEQQHCRGDRQPDRPVEVAEQAAAVHGSPPSPPPAPGSPTRSKSVAMSYQPHVHPAAGGPAGRPRGQASATGRTAAG